MTAGPRSSEPGLDRTVRLGELELPNPVVAASGTFGYGDEVARLCPAGRLGAVTVKSLAAFDWPGNPAPRLAPGTDGGMLNSVGLQGPGVEHWIEHELPELRGIRRARHRVAVGEDGRRLRASLRRCSRPRSTSSSQSR